MPHSEELTEAEVSLHIVILLVALWACLVAVRGCFVHAMLLQQYSLYPLTVVDISPQAYIV
jgi:hypothetical protein